MPGWEEVGRGDGGGGRVRHGLISGFSGVGEGDLGERGLMEWPGGGCEEEKGVLGEGFEQKGVFREPNVKLLAPTPRFFW